MSLYQNDEDKGMEKKTNSNKLLNGNNVFLKILIRIFERKLLDSGKFLAHD